LGIAQGEAAEMARETGEDTSEGREGAEYLLFAAAGALTLVGWALLWVVGKPTCMPLFYVGWVFLIVGLVMLALALLRLPRQGRAPGGREVRQTTVVVRSGLYGVIRHPVYLGWMLAFIALILLTQHWLVLAPAVLGIVCVYLITIQEERRLISRFGEEYVQYARQVARFNLLKGTLRMMNAGRKR
jgi:protein-S-isoprenylcysteine O-methyltransferase Ste14